MNEILFLSPGSNSSLRLVKIASVLKRQGFKVAHLGWPRRPEERCTNSLFETSEAVITGGGEANAKMPILYMVFIVGLFFKLLFRRPLKNTLIFCINFETAFVVWLISHFRKISYCYDIWDELALSHKFPKLTVKILKFFDRRIRIRATFYIHVDSSRYSEIDDGLNNSIVIYNSPEDYYTGKDIQCPYERMFAVTGWLNNTRGLLSIYQFAKDNPNFSFVVAGKFLNEDTEKLFMSLKNVEYHDFMPQHDLFKIISRCRGIFSLYDVRIPINRLAASNKLYDAMMLGIPVIVNTGLLAAEMVQEHNMGFVVNYDYDDSWSILTKTDISNLRKIGRAGRTLYLEKYDFVKMCEKVLIPKLRENIEDTKHTFHQ